MDKARKASAVGWCLLSTLLIGGCAHLRLPAIDQTGQRIFQPAPASTTLVNPFAGTQIGNGLQPAFTRPPGVPECNNPVAPPGAFAGPAACGPKASCPSVIAPVAPRVSRPGRNCLQNLHNLHSRKRKGEIQLFPGRVVAPVGTEVVLRAGICGDNGYYITCQPVEWILAHDSVGHFLQVGESSHLKHLLTHRKERKITNNFAVAQTLSRAQLLTRGTPDPSDDVTVLKGQSWISMTSASPGISHVTVLAPKNKEWDRRRKTATIHWVDAEWRLPQSASASSGQTVRLTTTVTQASSGSPLSNWIVRYEIEGESQATFIDGTKATEQLTDGRGNAIADLASPTGVSTAAQIRVQIIRPARQGGEIPRMIVGQGWSRIRWSSPGLAVEAAGPDTASVDRPVTYRIRVSNPGDRAASGVTLTTTPPANVDITGSRPTAQTLGDRLEWSLGTLQPGTSRTIDVYALAKVAQNARFTFQVKSAEGLADSKEVATQFIQPSLRIVAEDPAGPFQVGDVVKFRFEVVNTGTVPLNNVQLSDTFESGLEHSEGGTSPVTFRIGTLEPGKPFRKAISFKALQPGQHCHTLRVIADGGQAASVRRCIEVEKPAAAPKPTLSIRIEGPKNQQVGSKELYKIFVRNEGQTPSTNTQLVVRFPQSLSPTSATEGRSYAAGQLSWNLTTVGAGKEFLREIVFNFAAGRPQRVVTAEVRSAEGTFERTQWTINALRANAGAANPVPANSGQTNPAPAPQTPPRVPPQDQNPGANAPVTGKLELQLADTSDSVKVGDEVSFLLLIKNNRRQPDYDVVVTVELPSGLQVAPGSGAIQATSVPTLSNNNRTITFQALREMRAGERLSTPVRIRVKALEAGPLTVKASATSRLTDGKVETEETTNAYK